MTKTKEKRVNKTAEEVKNEMTEKAEQVSDQACAAEIEIILKKYNRALQPFLARSEFGDQPRVRMMRVAPEETKEDVEA